MKTRITIFIWQCLLLFLFLSLVCFERVIIIILKEGHSFAFIFLIQNHVCLTCRYYWYKENLFLKKKTWMHSVLCCAAMWMLHRVSMAALSENILLMHCFFALSSYCYCFHSFINVFIYKHPQVIYFIITVQTEL